MALQLETDRKPSPVAGVVGGIGRMASTVANLTSPGAKCTTLVVHQDRYLVRPYTCYVVRSSQFTRKRCDSLS
jgi:hypothetical protein